MKHFVRVSVKSTSALQRSESSKSRHALMDDKILLQVRQLGLDAEAEIFFSGWKQGVNVARLMGGKKQN